MSQQPKNVVRGRFARAVSLLVAGWAGFTASAQGAANDPGRLFQKYCYECHGEGAHKGKVDLEEMLTPANLKKQQREWERAWKIVRHEFMPPVDADQPTAAERKAITDWIAKEVFAVDFAKPDPGRVTIRRLNRVEYENSVHDLFGYDFAAEANYSSDGAGAVLRLRDRLPPDDTAYGFDNIGDFQTVSPALLEKYFDIADFVVSRVIQEAPREPEMNVSSEVKSIKSSTNDPVRLTSHTVAFEAKRAGDYRVDVQFTLGGWNEYGGAYDFALKLDDRSLANDLVEIGGYKRYRYTNVVSLSAGSHALAFTTAVQKGDFKGNKNHLELRPKIIVTGPIGNDFKEFSEAHRRLFFRGAAPTEKSACEAYAREILERIVTRAFRRAVDAETLNGLTKLAMRNNDFERGIAQSLTAILTSPKFFFRAETQPRPDDPKAIHPLDEYALASRLSYLLWLSIPDDELLQLARDGKLRANLRPQVQRMLADKKSERFFEDFPGQWLRTRNVLMTSITRDMDLNPVRGAMKRETEMLFEHIARNDRDLIELITADYSFMNKALAEFYGLTNLVKGDFQKVSLTPETKRGGILTHGSFLVASSNPNRTSPVKRGLFVLENLLSVEPPPPPPDIPPLDDAKMDGRTLKTVREQLAVHRENKSCAACHAHFDPIGVVLENYDLIGHWRTKENGEPIEAKEKTTSGETLSSVSDLKSYFAARKEKFYRGATEKFLTYALGRGLEPYDAVTVDRVAAAVAADGGKFSTLLFGVIESPAFQTRRGDDGEAKDAPRLAIPPTPPPEKRRPPKRFRNRENFEATNAAPAAPSNNAKTNTQTN
jgi:mono/diheme cytochrome c family protein